MNKKENSKPKRKMQPPLLTETENLIRMIREDCLRQAEIAEKKLGEVIEALHDGNHLGALGGFVDLDEDIAGLKVFLTRIARLTVGRTTRTDPSHAQPKTNA